MTGTKRLCPCDGQGNPALNRIIKPWMPYGVIWSKNKPDKNEKLSASGMRARVETKKKCHCESGCMGGDELNWYFILIEMLFCRLQWRLEYRKYSSITDIDTTSDRHFERQQQYFIFFPVRYERDEHSLGWRRWSKEKHQLASRVKTCFFRWCIPWSACCAIQRHFFRIVKGLTTSKRQCSVLTNSSLFLFLCKPAFSLCALWKNTVRCEFLTSTSPSPCSGEWHNRKSIEHRRLHHRESETECPNKCLSLRLFNFVDIFVRFWVRSLPIEFSRRHTSWINYDYAFWFISFFSSSRAQMNLIWFDYYYYVLCIMYVRSRKWSQQLWLNDNNVEEIFSMTFK